MRDGDIVQALESILSFSGGLAEVDIVEQDEADHGEGLMDSGEIDCRLDGRVGARGKEVEGGFAEDIGQFEEMGMGFEQLFLCSGEFFEIFPPIGAGLVAAFEDDE